MTHAPAAPVGLGVVLMTLTQALCVAVIFAVPVLAPAIAPATGIDVTLVGVYVALIYAIAVWSGAAGGAAAARHGAFAVSIGCLVLSALAALLASIGSVAGFVVAALVLGLVAGAETPASTQLLFHLVPAERRARMFSIRQTGNQFGAIAVSLSLPAAAAWQGWRSGLVALAGVCLAGALALALLSRRFHGVAAPSAVGRSGAIQSARLAWSAPGLRAMSLAAFTFSAMQVCLNGFMTTHAVTALGMSLTAAGVLLGTAQAAGLLARFGMGFAVERAGDARPVLIALGALMSVAALATAVLAPLLPWPLLLAVAALFGLSASGWNGVFVAESARLAPGGRAAEATGGAQVISYSGLTAGPLIYGFAVDATGFAGAGYAALALLTVAGTVLLAPRFAARRL